MQHFDRPVAVQYRTDQVAPVRSHDDQVAILAVHVLDDVIFRMDTNEDSGFEGNALLVSVCSASRKHAAAGLPIVSEGGKAPVNLSANVEGRSVLKE